jgi:hypothetical protein
MQTPCSQYRFASKDEPSRIHILIDARPRLVGNTNSHTNCRPVTLQWRREQCGIESDVVITNDRLEGDLPVTSTSGKQTVLHRHSFNSVWSVNDPFNQGK